MLIRLVALAVFVVLASAVGMTETLRTAGLQSVLVAISALALAIFLPTPALIRFARLLRPLLIIVFAAPALWMILQVIPVPVRELGNPIWSIASGALNEPLEARITVDIPATLLSLAQYCIVLATASVTAVIALDSRRAAHVLYMLVSITTLLATVWIVDGGATNFAVPAVLGVLLSCAMAIEAIDQFGRLGPPDRRGAVFTLSGAVLSLFVCSAAILSRASSTDIIAGLLGVGVLLAVVAIRKWFLGLWRRADVAASAALRKWFVNVWVRAGVAAAAAIVLFASFTVIPIRSSAFSSVISWMQNETVTERMLRDSGQYGSGAGAFRALLPIYRDVGLTPLHEQPTAAAAIAIDMGLPFLCGLIVVAVMGAGILFKRSLSRDQGYLYAAVGAGASISLLTSAFAGNGILNLGASLLIAALCGLVCGQGVSGDQAGDPDPAAGQDLSPSPVYDSRWARIALTCLGIILTTQAALILSADRRLRDGVSGSLALSNKLLPEKTLKAISISTARGDLWTQTRSMFVAQGGEQSAVSDQQKSTFPSAMNAAAILRHSPSRGDVWLMLAAISKQYKSAGYNTADLLKMSYYTAPNDLDLFPLRLSVALGTDDVVMNPELRDLIKRDLNLVLTRRPLLRPALTAAYQAASAEGKIFAEKTIYKLDPNYLGDARARHQ